MVRIIQQYPLSKKKAWRIVSYSEGAQYSYFHKILSCIRCTETDYKFKKSGEEIRGKREVEPHWVLKYQFIVLTSFLCFDDLLSRKENLALPISKTEMWFTVFMEAFVFEISQLPWLCFIFHIFLDFLFDSFMSLLFNEWLFVIRVFLCFCRGFLL